MIISVGEILVDMIGEGESYTMKIGGAPFNMAANAACFGQEVAFVGKIGKDVPGKFIKERAGGFGIKNVKLIEDDERNTTLAFVSLDNGERSFSFFRRDTADYNMTFEQLDLASLGKADVIHLGSLMISSPQGERLARRIAEYALINKIHLSFDINLREDLWKSLDEARAAYRYFVDKADIIKFSDDEIKWYTGESDLDKAISKLPTANAVIAITLGKEGSICICDGKVTHYKPKETLAPIDTTGAGDAFFGALVAGLAGKPLSAKTLEQAFNQANLMGARATQALGALGHIEAK